LICVVKKIQGLYNIKDKFLSIPGFLAVCTGFETVEPTKCRFCKIIYQYQFLERKASDIAAFLVAGYLSIRRQYLLN
jgi:hypothetical protein